MEGIDREQREVWLLFCIAQEVYVHELANFEVLGSNVLNDLGKVFRHVAAFRYELWYDELEDATEQSLVGTDRYESLHRIEFFPVAVRVELLPNIEKLGLVICIEVGNVAADNSQVPCVLRERLLNSHSQPRGIFCNGVEVLPRHAGYSPIKSRGTCTHARGIHSKAYQS